MTVDTNATTLPIYAANLNDGILDELATSPEVEIEAGYGMHNGLITNATELAGSDALYVVEQIAKELGYTIALAGTNDDEIGIVILPIGDASTTKEALDKIAEALVRGLRLFGITANKAKMVIGGPAAEINTLTRVVRRSVATTVLPGIRNSTSAVRSVTGSTTTASAKAAIAAPLAGLKEGGNLVTAYVTGAFAWLTHYARSGLEPLFLNTCAEMDAQAAGEESYHDFTEETPGDGIGSLGTDDPAPHLTGRPVLRPYLAVFGTEAIIANTIFERMRANKDMRPRLYKNIITNMALEKLSSILDQPYDTDFKSNVRAVPPPDAVAVGPPNFRALHMYARKEVTDPIYTKDTLASYSFAEVCNKGRSALSKQVLGALTSEMASLRADPFRIKDHITHKAAYGRHPGNMNTPADEKQLYLLIQMYKLADGTFKLYERTANLGTVVKACRSFDWGADVVLPENAAITSLAAALERNAVNCGIAFDSIRSEHNILIRGPKRPTAVSKPRTVHKEAVLSTTDIAKLISTNPAIAECIDYIDLSAGALPSALQWKHRWDAVTYNDVQETIRLAELIKQETTPIDTKGYIVPANQVSLDAVQLAISLGTNNVGAGTYIKARPKQESTLAEAKVTIRRIDTTISQLATASTVAYVEKRTMQLEGKEANLGVLPDRVATNASGTVLDFDTKTKALKALTESCAISATVNLTDRTYEHISLRAHSLGLAYVAPGKSVKAVRGVHFMHKDTKRGGAIHCVASMYKTLSKTGTAKDVLRTYTAGYSLNVICSLSRAQLQDCMLVVNVSNKTIWIQDPFSTKVIPGTDITLNILDNDELHTSIYCYPPMYCLATSEYVFPYKPVVFDVDADQLPSLHGLGGTIRDVSLTKDATTVAIKILRLLASSPEVRNSYLVTMSTLDAWQATHELTTVLIKSSLEVDEIGVAIRKSNYSKLKAILQGMFNNRHTKAKRRGLVDEITLALVMQGIVAKTYAYSREAVAQCGFYVRDLPVLTDAIATEFLGYDPSTVPDLEYTDTRDTPLAVGMYEDPTPVKHAPRDDDDTSDEEADMPEIWQMIEHTKPETTLRETAITDPTIVVGEATIRIDDFGNEMKEEEVKNGTLVGGGIEAIEEYRERCWVDESLYIETPLTNETPFNLSCSRALSTVLLAQVKRAYGLESGLVTGGVVGSASCMRGYRVHTNTVQFATEIVFSSMDQLIGLGKGSELTEIWQQSRGVNGIVVVAMDLETNTTEGVKCITEGSQDIFRPIARAVTSATTSQYSSLVDRIQYRTML